MLGLDTDELGLDGDDDGLDEELLGLTEDDDGLDPPPGAERIKRAINIWGEILQSIVLIYLYSYYFTRNKKFMNFLFK